MKAYKIEKKDNLAKGSMREIEVVHQICVWIDVKRSHNFDVEGGFLVNVAAHLCAVELLYSTMHSSNTTEKL